jgi:hypothetical protein
VQCYSHAKFKFYRDFFFLSIRWCEIHSEQICATCLVAGGQDGRAIDARQLLQLQPQQTQVELFRILTLKGLFHEISLQSAPATADTGGTLPDPHIKRTVSWDHSAYVILTQRSKIKEPNLPCRYYKQKEEIKFSNCANIYSNTLVHNFPPPHSKERQNFCISNYTTTLNIIFHNSFFILN